MTTASFETTASFDEVTQQIRPLVEEKLQSSGAQSLRDLTVDVIWNSRRQTGSTRLTPAIVDLVLRQLNRLGFIVIADDGAVTLSSSR